jgi:hypothetical protein
VQQLTSRITSWLAEQHLEPDALAAVIPAARRVSSTQQQQVAQQLEAWLVPQAARSLPALVASACFLDCWEAEDVAVLLRACSSQAVVTATVKAVHAWVARDPSVRSPHWPHLLDCLDFGSMSAADMVAVRKEVPKDPELTDRMFSALLARQVGQEEAAQGGS